MNIYVIRHGQTPWNVERRLQGRSDTDLNEIGREMAIETGKAFQKVHFDVVFTSPLKRARETAELFLGDRKVPVIEEPRIRRSASAIMRGWPAEKIITAFRTRISMIFLSIRSTTRHHQTGKAWRNWGPGQKLLWRISCTGRSFRTKLFWYPATAAPPGES